MLLSHLLERILKSFKNPIGRPLYCTFPPLNDHCPALPNATKSFRGTIELCMNLKPLKKQNLWNKSAFPMCRFQFERHSLLTMSSHQLLFASIKNRFLISNWGIAPFAHAESYLLPSYESRDSHTEGKSHSQNLADRIIAQVVQRGSQISIGS